ncbi:MAG: protein kinase [Planctomycetota bacterium]|nr:protein kinase [Planctomycetota bacterium]
MTKSIQLLLVVLSISMAAHADSTGNLLANPSFEHDWINGKAEKQLISAWGEHGFNQQDLKPDAWSYQLPAEPENRAVSWDATEAHSGRYSLRMSINPTATANTSMLASQSQPYAGYLGEPGKDVFDSDRKTWQVQAIPLSRSDVQRFFRSLRLSAWCKASQVPEGARILVAFVRGPTSASLEFPVGTYDWQKRELEIPAAAIAEAYVRSLRDQATGTLPASWTVSLQFVPPANNPSGTVWFDNVAIEENLPSSPNLAPNSSFEQVTEDEVPHEWTGPQKFHFVPPAWYYVWRDWSHFFSPPRGKVASDAIVARSGARSFRFSVLPGDEMFCESKLISINQSEARFVEIGIWLKADKIRFFDLRAVDENGIYLNDQSFITSTHSRESGATHRGSFDWRYFRKFFVSDRPLKSVRVRLCARGFNGLHVDDTGKKATNNQAGTLWWDDLIVTDPLADPVANSSPPPPRPQIHLTAIDFGERLFGENRVRLEIKNSGDKPCRAKAEVELTPPSEYGAPAKVSQSKEIIIGIGNQETLEIPYSLWQVCRDWRSQYHLKVALIIDGLVLGSTEVNFGTWPEIGRVEVERVFPLPDESRSQNIWVNFGVTAETLAKVKALRFDFIRRGTGKVVKSVRVREFQNVLDEFRKTQPLANWWVDEFQLFMRSFDLSFLPVHPEDRPTRDHMVAVVAEGGLFAREIFRCESVPFGVVGPNTEELEPVRSVEVRNGATWVNGEPFFLRGCLGHSWNLEPAPSQRPPWVETRQSPEKKQILDFSRVKRHGFNSFWPNVPVGLDYFDSIWKSNLYSAVWYPKNWFGLAFDDRYGERWRCASTPDEIKAAGTHPSLLLTSLTAWEGGMQEEVYTDPKLLKAQEEFADSVRLLGQRPLFSSGGYSAHKQQYGTMWDVFGPESNWDGPSRVPVTVLHRMRSLGKNVSSLDFPNIFNDMAFDLIRFETYEGIIRGQRGFVQIGKWGDNLLDLPEFEEFTISERIGVGANAQVFRAVQRKVARDVALKIHTDRDEEVFLKRFLREAESLAKLNHVNIVQAIDTGEVEGTHYFAMELVNGPTLQDILTVYHRLSERRAMKIAQQLASSLLHIDEHQMVHRDLKPTNVLMDGERAKLCDLGLARQIGVGPEAFMVTQQGVVVGTPHYLSPEQARGESNLDIRTDLYSLGAIIYKMVTGRLMFDDVTLHGLLHSQIHNVPEDARKLCPSLSYHSYRLLKDLLAKDVARRPGARETCARIEECLSHLAPDTKPLPTEVKTTSPDEKAAEMKAPAMLVTREGDHRRTIPLFGDEILLGRQSGCHILLRDPWVSRRHLMIRRTGDRWVLEDLNSHNGTRVNGVNIRRRVLESGDVIQVKDSLLEFQIEGD